MDDNNASHVKQLSFKEMVANDFTAIGIAPVHQHYERRFTMLKVLLASAALVVGTSALAGASPALLTGRSASKAHHYPDHHPMHYHRMTHHHTRHNHVTAGGRCNGISYGTGQRSCGTATGGTPGGNPSRN